VHRISIKKKLTTEVLGRFRSIGMEEHTPFSTSGRFKATDVPSECGSCLQKSSEDAEMMAFLSYYQLQNITV
jgi:hypothetical protein